MDQGLKLCVDVYIGMYISCILDICLDGWLEIRWMPAYAYVCNMYICSNFSTWPGVLATTDFISPCSDFATCRLDTLSEEPCVDRAGS